MFLIFLENEVSPRDLLGKTLPYLLREDLEYVTLKALIFLLYKLIYSVSCWVTLEYNCDANLCVYLLESYVSSNKSDLINA